MKVLWFSNALLSNDNVKGTGSWLYTMASALVENGIQLFNITQSSTINAITKHDIRGEICEWVIPSKKFSSQSLPPQSILEQIQSIVYSISPDIVHVWGLEAYWGLLFSQGVLSSRVSLLDIQGLYSECARVYMGALSFKEQLQCIGLREVAWPFLSVFALKRKFQKLGQKEEKAQLHCFKFISYQSEWVKAQIIPSLNNEAELYKTSIGVRESFFKSSYDTLRVPSDSARLLTVYGGNSPYKGKHDVIKALAILKKDYPQIHLTILGCPEATKPIWRQSGYFRFLKRLIRKFELIDNVEFVGNCNADEMVNYMQTCHLMIHSSYVESYSLCLAESMSFGIPCVISYAGAMPELARNEITGLFYSPGDYHMCAAQIRRLLSSEDLRRNISLNSKNVAYERNLPSKAGNRQLEIYSSLLKNAD